MSDTSKVSFCAANEHIASKVETLVGDEVIDYAPALTTLSRDSSLITTVSANGIDDDYNPERIFSLLQAPPHSLEANLSPPIFIQVGKMGSFFKPPAHPHEEMATSAMDDNNDEKGVSLVQNNSE